MSKKSSMTWPLSTLTRAVSRGLAAARRRIAVLVVGFFAAAFAPTLALAACQTGIDLSGVAVGGSVTLDVST